MNAVHIEILDKKRQELLPLFGTFKKDFYLAGGTALALILGHRDSIDFDFFSQEEFSTEELYKKLQNTFKERSIKKIQEEKDTLTILIDGIKISFFSYPYEILDEFIDMKYLRIASLKDIGCMKLSTITSRATIKDYVDLYYILRKKNLDTLLTGCSEKFPQLDKMLILKSLVYFNDIETSSLRFVRGKEINMEEIKKYFENLVKEYLKSTHD